MEAKELRIGNYVTDRGGKALRIDWFEREKVCCERITINGIQLHPLTERFEFCKPIELTEELLLKLGFEKCNDLDTFYSLDIMNGWTKIYYTPKHNIFEISISYHASAVKIKYLHQLQNLYFALTGEELKIEL